MEKTRQKIVFASLFLLLFSLPQMWAAHPVGTASLHGTVTDQADGQPLPGVSIYLPELKEGTVTDLNGRYSLTGLPAVQTTVQVSYVGHQTIVRTVNLCNTVLLDFQLEEANAMLSEVVVTGLTGTELISRSPSPVSIISPHELHSTPSTNIIDALSRQPGVAQVTTGSGISKPVIRGLGYNRILVVNDGIRQEGQQWGDEHGVEIDPQRVHSVEILKGPASLVYGSDAMAGVIIFHDDPVMPRGTMSANASGEYQSNNGLWAYSADFAGNRGGVVWNWRWSQKAAHDYENKYDGRVVNSRFAENALSGLLGINRRWGYSHLKLSLYQLKPGMTEGERDPETGNLLGGDEEDGGGPKSYKSMEPYQEVKHYKAVLDNTFLIGDGSLKVIAGYQNNGRQEFHHHEHHHEEGLHHDEDEHHHDEEECGLHFVLHTLNYDVHFLPSEYRGWKSSVGVQGMYQKSENHGDEFLIPAYNLFDAGAFATTCRSWGVFHVSGGLRFDTRHLHSHRLMTEDEGLRFAAFKRTFNGLTGSLGAICNLSDQANLRLNISRGFRAPNLSELGSNGSHEGTLRYEVGNSNLEAEYSWQADLGFDYSSPVVSAQAALFANHIDNYIFAQRGTETAVGPEHDGLPVFHYAQGTARIAGGEASIDIHPVEALHFENAFSYVSSVQLHQPRDRRYLPFTPPARWLSTLRYDIVRDGKTLNNTFVALEMDHNFRQGRCFTAYDTETPTPAYTLWNLSAGTDFRHNGRRVATVFVFAHNIFDCAYQNHLSRLKYADVNPVTGRRGIFNMGRNIGVKVSVPLF